MILILLILSIFFIFSSASAPYYGLRIGMKPKSFGRDIISVIDDLLDHLDGSTYPDINDTSGKGMNLQGLFIQNISLLGIHHPLALYDFSNMKIFRNSIHIKGL